MRRVARDDDHPTIGRGRRFRDAPFCGERFEPVANTRLGSLKKAARSAEAMVRSPVSVAWPRRCLSRPRIPSATRAVPNENY
jgi:hypothetical protein